MTVKKIDNRFARPERQAAKAEAVQIAEDLYIAMAGYGQYRARLDAFALEDGRVLVVSSEDRYVDWTIVSAEKYNRHEHNPSDEREMMASICDACDLIDPCYLADEYRNQIAWA